MTESKSVALSLSYAPACGCGQPRSIGRIKIRCRGWSRELDLNQRPQGYDPCELPGEKRFPPGNPCIASSLVQVGIGWERRAGGEGVSQSPLKDQAFSTFQEQYPPFELRRNMGFRLRQKPVPPNGPSSTTVSSSDERKVNCRRTAHDRPAVAESDGGSSSSGPALLFPSAVDVVKEP